MRGHGLRALLDDIQKAVRATGTADQASSLTKLSDALSGQDDDDVAELAKSVEEKVRAGLAPAREAHAMRLKEAGFEEGLFLLAFHQMESDKSLKKADLAWIADELGAFFDKKATAEKITKVIKGKFYERLYERDANAMAKRATPW